MLICPMGDNLAVYRGCTFLLIFIKSKNRYTDSGSIYNVLKAWLKIKTFNREHISN